MITRLLPCSDLIEVFSAANKMLHQGRLRFCLLGVALWIGSGCGGNANVGRTFDQEMQLTLKAGRGELTDSEKQQLLRENHPILAQVGSPQASKLVARFASFPESIRKQLLQESYVKWRLSDLDAETQTD